MKSKIVLISDLHWGCRNDISIFYNYFDKFYDNLLHYMLDSNLTELFILGDGFDRRKYVNFKTLNAAKRIFYDKFADAKINIHFILGNHDIHYKETLSLSSPSLLLQEYTNVVVYDDPRTITIGNTSIDMIPWLCKENETDIVYHIKKSNADLCFGHFEFANFPMHKGVDNLHGMATDMFQKYELVCSGHYHTRSQRDNIVYLGTPYEINWQDYGDDKGFHTFDLNSRELQFHKNHEVLFYKLIYDEDDMIDLAQYNLTDCFVRLIVVNKKDLYKFDQFVNQMYSKGCYEIKIIEDINDVNDGEIGEEIDLEDTLDVLSNYIDSIGLQDKDTKLLNQFMKSLYLEAVNSEGM